MNVSSLSNSNPISASSVISTQFEVSYEDVVKSLVEQSLIQKEQEKQA